MNSRDVALISVFAAFYPIVQLLNLGFPVIGGSGIINLALILGPMNGLILGPVNGTIATAIGAMIGVATGIGASFSPLIVLNRSLGAAEAGFLVKKDLTIYANQKRQIPGWVASILILMFVASLWYVFPVGRGAPLYPSLHLTGVLVATLLNGKASQVISSPNRSRVALGIAVASYCAVLADHMMGTLIFISVMGWHSSEYSALFMSILPISSLERVTLAVLATVLGTPILLISRSLGIEAQRQ